MKLKTLIFLLLILAADSFGQFDDYCCRREIAAGAETWRKIVLPDEVFRQTNADLSDIRVFGVAETGEIVEAPYILRQARQQITEQEIEFKLINQSRAADGFYYTFEVPSNDAINQIDLKFNEPNFDWRVRLEGSQNQNEWFTVAENYRILSIRNASTDYAFTAVEFPDAKFIYFRLLVLSNENPRFTSAKLTRRQTIPGSEKIFPVKSFAVSRDEKMKQTVIDVELPHVVPVSSVKINVRDDFDFYRPVTVKYLASIAENSNNARPFFLPAGAGVLSSLERKELQFPEVKTDRLQILIGNQDNQPLNIDSVEVKGIPYELIARFTQPAKYYLVYGNRRATKPNYDINNFTEKIPEALAETQIGGEESVPGAQTARRKPVLENPLWIWAVIIPAIILLGWFSLKILRDKA